MPNTHGANCLWPKKDNDIKMGCDVDPVLPKKPDPGLYTSNARKFVYIIFILAEYYW